MTTTNHSDTILIIDFGSQVTQLIARRVREAGVYCEIVPFQSADEAFKRIRPKGVILSGSPHSTVDIGSPQLATRTTTLESVLSAQLDRHSTIATRPNQRLIPRRYPR